MNLEYHRIAGEPAATDLWLMLPGAYMKPQDFVAAGFVTALRERGLRHDVALLDATLVDVADGNALAFLQESLRSGPACAYLRTHLVGISLGAHLAMACLSRAGSDAGAAGEAAARVDSACLLAPYLGPRDIVAEVSASGTGDPGAATHLPRDIDRRIWHWLQRRGASDPPLFLGYGSEDRFAPAHALMARRLPAGRVHVVPGGHHWPVWTRLWQHYLDSFHAHD